MDSLSFREKSTKYCTFQSPTRPSLVTLFGGLEDPSFFVCAWNDALVTVGSTWHGLSHFVCFKRATFWVRNEKRTHWSHRVRKDNKKFDHRSDAAKVFDLSSLAIWWKDPRMGVLNCPGNFTHFALSFRWGKELIMEAIQRGHNKFMKRANNPQ